MSSGDSLIVITANIKQKIENGKNNKKKKTSEKVNMTT